MDDRLIQLLRNADKQSPAPMVDPATLPARIRRTVQREHEHRVVGGIAASIVLFVASVIGVAVHHRNVLPPSPIAQVNTESTENIRLQAQYHERVAALLSAHREAAPPVPSVSDSFLQQLQLERSKAALVMLKMSTNQTDESNSQRLDRLRQMIALFPETSAAAEATQRIQQLENSRRPL